MTNIGYATLSVIPSLKGFQGTLERGTAPGITSAGKSAGKRFGGAFGSAMRGTIAGLGIFSAGSAALRFLGDSVQEGRESIRIGKQTSAVIKSTGGVAKVTEKSAGRLANTLKRLSGVDDELIQGSENVLLTFKNIRNEQGENNKIFDKATKASLNLSTALDKDLGSSALMVGKALNDPVAGMTALGRAGVQFSQDQKDAIKKLVETGDTLGAQKVILKELNSEFKGSARAQRTEADRLSTAWGDFKEQIGKQLIPVLDDLATFLRKKGIPRAKEFFGWVRDEGVPAVKDIAKFAGRAAGKVKGLVDEFNGMPGWAKKILIGGGAAAVVGKKLSLGKILTGSGDGIFSKGASPARPLYVWVVNDVGGGGGPGKPTSKIPVAPLLKGAATASLIAGIAGGITAGVGKVLGAPNHALLGAGSGGSGSLPAGSDFFNLDDDKIKAHNRTLSETKKKWVDARLASKDYAFQVHNGIPRSALTTVTNWTLENKKARDYLATLLEIRGVHMDTRLDNAGGSGTTPGSGIAPNLNPTPHGGHRGDHIAVPQRGVQVIINGDVKPYDSREFFGDLKKRSVQSSSDGWLK